MSAPEPVYVAVWGELRGDSKRLPGVLRVLVGGQHAGAVQRTEGGWTAQAHGLRPTPGTMHATPEEAVRTLLRSSWARRLGARAASHVYWSERAKRELSRKGGAR